MDQPISSLMTKTVVSVRPDDTVRAVGEVLRENALSFVPVMDSRSATVVGVLGAADLLQFQASKRDPEAVHAWEICTYKPVEVTVGTPVREVAALMLARGIHHVVVMDGQQLAGVVSSLDFVRQCLD
jgi:CBS domain-containing protein